MNRTGWTFAAATSACCFGLSGTFAKPLLDAGWSPGAASLLRCLIGALLLGIPAVRAMRGRWLLLRRAWPAVLAFGAIGVAGSQGGYFVAVGRIPVSTALMVEYLAPVLLVAVTAVVRLRLPPRPVLAGALVAVAGLVAVLGPTGGRLDPAGLAAAGVAMAACAAYYALAASIDLPPMALAGFGLAVAAAATALLGAAGLLPLAIGRGEVRLLGAAVPAAVPIAVVGLVSTVLAYALGVGSASRIGSRAASFVGLVEVLAATAAAAAVLGQVPGPLQLAGGGVLLAGVLLVVSAPAAPAGVPISRPATAA